ncbi:hypothetical protein RJ640_019980 [Escallonia rubra]|uniref:Uncharacterized protein n=1 Tax=Escallonia rubra TaxID=112253 RepID=A0AA88QLW4_9ASTE|nr:hypothetical protein RJ640_019980 [Escallonia rubra]
MQSRLASTSKRINRAFLFRPVRWLASVPPPTNRPADPVIYAEKPEPTAAPLPTGKAADPAIYAENPEEHEPFLEGIGKERPENAASTAQGNQKDNRVEATNENEPTIVRPRIPHALFPKLESTGVNRPAESITQQKRYNSVTHKVEDFSCAGLDGSPWPEDGTDLREQEERQQGDNRKYFKHHKASPLSEIEVTDTRKPITRATDESADSYFEREYGERVVLWRPEQLDTAEDSLRRAMEMWRESATRGIPDAPHSRVLRELREVFFFFHPGQRSKERLGLYKFQMYKVPMASLAIT